MEENIFLKIYKAMKNEDILTPRERKILLYRFFGIKEIKAHTLEEVGREFDVTRERIRQIEAKALDKLDRLSKYQ